MNGDADIFKTQLEDLEIQSTDFIDIRNQMSEYTDTANGARFAAQHRCNTKYCHKLGCWLCWDYKRWSKDEILEVQRRAKKTAYSIYIDAADEDLDEKTREGILKFCKNSLSVKGITSMLESAKSETTITIKEDMLDSNKYLINLQNCTFDLKTGNQLSHYTEHYITKLANITYDKDAKCPNWIEFLNLIFDNDAETIKFVQKACGYSLSGDIGEQCLFILWGAGENGKTTFLDTIMSMLNDYAMPVPTETFMMKDKNGGGPNNDIAMLKGARFVTAAESEDGKRLAESLIKQLTGGDMISARFLHKEFFQFKPEFKLWFCTQHRPEIRGTDRGIWRRIRLVPFNVNVPNKLRELGKERQKNYHEQLLAESSGIFNWMLEGWHLWQKEGLEMSAAIEKATKEYNQEMDIIQKFIDDCCDRKPGSMVLYKDLYNEYVVWCEYYKEYKLSNRKFASRLTEKGYQKDNSTGNQVYWKNIIINEEKVKTFKVNELTKWAENPVLPFVKQKPVENLLPSITLVNSLTQESKLKLPDSENKFSYTFDAIRYIKECINFINNDMELKSKFNQNLDLYVNGKNIKHEDKEKIIKILLEIGEIMQLPDGTYEVTQ